MEQGSSASALAARTAGMTDEQILDLDLEALQAGGGVTTSLAAEAPLTGDFGLGGVTAVPGTNGAPGLPVQPVFRSTVPVDELLDDHATEFEECRRWASSDAGQIARAQNPAGFANVRAHAAEHAAALVRQGQTSLVLKAP